MELSSDKPANVMSDITNGANGVSHGMKKNTSLLFESIPENHVYNPSDVNNENQIYPLKSSLSMKKSMGNNNMDKKVCFENSPMVVEYDKLSSEDEMSLRNSNSQQSVDSGNSRIATNFQLTWKPTSYNNIDSENKSDPAVKHSQHPKPLPPMPSNLPQSESLQQDINILNQSNSLSNTNIFSGYSQDNESDLHGNTSEIYPPQVIEIPKLRKPNDIRLLDQSVDIGQKMQQLKIDESISPDYNKNDFSIGDYIDNSNSTVNKFNFNSSPPSPSKLEQRKQMSAINFEDALDSVLPPDRTPSTIIKENNRMYSKYRGKNRVPSNNSDSYYEDVVLDTVRQNVDNKFSQQRNSAKRFIKIAENPKIIEQKNQEEKDEFTIGDYLNDDSVPNKETFEDVTSSSNQSAQKESFTSTGKPNQPEPSNVPSRMASIGSSVPLGESTMDHSIFNASQSTQANLEPPTSPQDHLDVAELSQEDVAEEEIDDQMDISHDDHENEQDPIDNSNSFNQDVSLKQDDSDAFKPFSESVFLDKSNEVSNSMDASNDSNASNFTLKLMQMKREKEKAQTLLPINHTPFSTKNDSSITSVTTPVSNKRSRDDDITDNSAVGTPRSLAPTRLTNSVLDTLLTKTNEYVAKSGVSVPSGNTSETKTKIFSNKHSFDQSNKESFNDSAKEMFSKPNKDIFSKPLFPRSPTQDSLSSTEEVHNIWANIKNKSDKHQKASTIRSQSMKSSPSMNSLEIKKMLKAKRKISQTTNAPPLPVTADTSMDISNRVGNNFINDTIDRGSSGGEDDLDDEDMEDDPEEEDEYVIGHIADELSKIPKPLLPEQHFDNFSDLEQEITQEFDRYDQGSHRGYTTRMNTNELIVAKLENQEDSNAIVADDHKKIFLKEKTSNGKDKLIPNEIFNSKKPHIYQGIVKKPHAKEIRVSNGSQYSRNRKTSEDSGSTKYVSARNSVDSKEINVRKRKSGALKDKFGNNIPSQRVPSNGRVSSGGSIYERQISAPKSHRLSTATKRGQSLRGSIHDATSLNTTMASEPLQVAHKPYPEPILEDENNYFDVNLPKDDQGRLYVRIVGLKNLDLPAIDSHHAKFSLILDNGIHCISTPDVDLDTNTSINQEFELTVSDNLEFILTLKAVYSYEGQEKLVEVTEKYPVRKRVLGGLLGHKTIYKTRQRLVSKIDKTDPWDTKMAKDGSFARAYVDFAQYEPLITGKACNFDVTCFNEWETYAENGRIKKRQPYRIGKLELQMLYIPRTKVNEVFPPSIHIAYEAVKEYQRQLNLSYEGYLSQEGGDCNYLKRRWFTLNGTDLIAHNEFSKKTRAKINLIKAVGLLSSNIKRHYHTNPNQIGGRRLSDEIIMHQGFKIKFMNGEIIEFVADSQQEKLNWLRVLDQVISKNKFRQAWIKILYDQLS